MPEPAISRSALARLVHGRERSSVRLRQDGALFAGQDAVWVGSLVQPAQADEGWFWATLAFETPNGLVALKGYRKSEAREFVDEVNLALRSEAVTRIEQRCAPLRALRDRVLGHRGYMQHLDVVAYQGDATRAANLRRDRLWMTFSNPEQQELLAWTHRLASDPTGFAAEFNSAFVERELVRYGELFDTVESAPLTQQQRLACVRNEENNLVVAGAGTGKTSTMVGRAAYLLASGIATGEQILMMAFARKAADEMQQRLVSRIQGEYGAPTATTFHALGLSIVSSVDGLQPLVSDLATDSIQFEKFVTSAIEVNCDDPDYLSKWVRLLGTGRFVYRSPFDFQSIEEYEQYVTDQELRTLAGEAVKSFEELEIANCLAKHSVRYTYEAPYEHDTRDPAHRQYKPDFYLDDYGVYLEHFALDHRGNPPSHFQGYLEGVHWKRALHEKYGTTLLETYSHEKRDGVLETALLAKLEARGVELRIVPDAELLERLRQDNRVLEGSRLIGDLICRARDAGIGANQLRSLSARAVDSGRFQLVADIALPVIHAYEERLAERGEVDFSEMIIRAIDYVESGRFESPFTHVMVDEFQDISASRARLVRALAHQKTGCTFFAVGDDWQSIYRFAGSDVGLTSRFEGNFGPTATTVLDTTFRFNDRICAVASSFIQKNPDQLKKRLECTRSATEAAVVLVASSSPSADLRRTLEVIASQIAGAATVLVLGRYNFTLEALDRDYRQLLARELPGLRIEFATAHAAKGKESDFVVVLGLKKGRMGFPCTKPTDDVLDALLPPLESYRLAEERRLFYVALTRARECVYVLYDPASCSEFVTELLTEHSAEYVARYEPDGCEPVSVTKCPRCATGVLVKRRSETGNHFFGCDNYPYCEHTEPACPDCGSAMRIESGVRCCSSQSCSHTEPICPVCGAPMKLRSGRWGQFWGCTNYVPSDPNPCKGKVKVSDFPPGRNG